MGALETGGGVAAYDDGNIYIWTEIKWDRKIVEWEGFCGEVQRIRMGNFGIKDQNGFHSFLRSVVVVSGLCYSFQFTLIGQLKFMFFFR